MLAAQDAQHLFGRRYGGASTGFLRHRREMRREEGQGAVEYALAVLAVAAIIAAAMGGFTQQITNFMTGAGTKLQSYIPK